LQRIGRSLIVRPSWVRYTMKRGDVVIDIDPGMAFGTGQHPTTAMCLRALEELVGPGSSVLDLGCGSGILAIAAARLGASRVLAIDNDPQAVAASLANVAVNNVSASVEVREGTLDAASDRFDIVVANISGLTLERIAPAIGASLNEGGRLIASGFLEDAIDGLRDAFSSAGMATERIDEDSVWRAIIARRADA
jgi:ribosomal protein L11 methyltransferase